MPAMCIATVLSGIQSTCLADFSDLLYLAYEHFLRVGHSQVDLLHSVRLVASSFQNTGLFLNVYKCGYLVFNGGVDLILWIAIFFQFLR